VKISIGSSGFNYPEYSQYFYHLTLTNPSDGDLALVVNTTFYLTDYPNYTVTYPLGSLLFDNITLSKDREAGIPIRILFDNVTLPKNGQEEILHVTSEEISSLLRTGSPQVKRSMEITGSGTYFLWNFSKTKTVPQFK
jgi:hypothetical protein